MKKTIAITGASDGLGAALLDEATSRGYDTLNISRRQNMRATKNIAVDLTTDMGIEHAAEAIKKERVLAAVIHCAGVFSFGGPCDVRHDEYDRVMNINVKAPLLLTHHIWETVQKHGVDLVFINSVAGQKAFKGQILYDVSKWALRGMTEDLRLELAESEARVIGVYPGMIDTDIAQKPPVSLPKSKYRMIDPAELAKLIIDAIDVPKSMVVTDIIIDRRR